MELSELQKRVDAWIREYGVRYFSELTNMAILTEEVGELARVMARKYGDQSFKAGEKENLADEMADGSGKIVEPVAHNDRHTQALLEFNRMIREDERVENVIVPIRDGLNLIRVK